MILWCFHLCHLRFFRAAVRFRLQNVLSAARTSLQLLGTEWLAAASSLQYSTVLSWISEIIGGVEVLGGVCRAPSARTAEGSEN